MNTTSIVKKTATKKTEKKEYLFNEDVWRIIMSYVGTLQQFIHKKMGNLIDIKNQNIRDINETLLRRSSGYLSKKLEISRISLYDRLTPIVITLKDYEFEGFKYQHITLNKYVDVYDMLNEIPYTIKEIVNEFYATFSLGKDLFYDWYINSPFNPKKYDDIRYVLIETKFLDRLNNLKLYFQSNHCSNGVKWWNKSPQPFNYIVVISNPKK